MLWLIILHAPIWVWPLLLGLIALGTIQLWDRSVPGVVVLALPVVMVAYGAYGLVATFGLDPRALVAWCAGILVTIALNQTVFGIPRGVVRDPADWRFLVRGSLLPLAVIMAIFWTRFVLGVFAGMSPVTLTAPSVIIGVAFWLGLCSGFFPARALRILGAKRAIAPTPPPGDGRQVAV